MKQYFPLFVLLLLVFSGCKKDPALLPDISTGLVVNIPLDGTAFDSVSGVTGITSFVIPVSNRHNEPNKAFLFNRNDSSFIDFGDLVNASFTANQFTICCWINVIDSLSPVSVLSKRGVTGPWEYSIDNHFSKAVFNLDNWVSDGSTTVYGIDPLKASATFRPGMWEHIAFVADGTTLKAYLNGMVQPGMDQHNAGLSFTDTDGHLVIGDGGGYGRNYVFNGCIDDLRMYNKALDAATIQYLSTL